MALPPPGSVERVLVFPRSGFINRFQTLASARILADQLDASFSVCWLPCPFVSGPASDTFSTGFCRDYVLDAHDVRAQFGIDMDEVPRYVSHDVGGRWVGLRGHDRGEQALVAECLESIAAHAPLRLLVIVAGGSFFTPDDGDMDDARSAFLASKRDFYRSLPLASEVENAVAVQLDADPAPYLGLHLRYTDRSHQAPFARDIRRALRKASADTGLRRLFVASDSGAARRQWHQEALDLGLEPWSFDPVAAGVKGPHAALIDWRLLGHASRLVYFSESSYSVEAAVASGTWDESIGLGAHPVRSAALQSRAYAGAGWRRLTRGGPTA